MIGAFVFALAVQPDELAFVARFYKPGSAKSRYELYVSNREAKQRRLLPMPEEPFRAVWQGKNHLLVETDKHWYVGDVRAWKPVLIKGALDQNLVESRNRAYPPGEPWFQVDEQPGYLKFDLAKRAFVPHPSAKSGDIPLNEEGLTEVQDPNGNTLKLQQFEPFSFLVKGKEVAADYEFQRVWRVGDSMFMVCGTHSSSSGSVNQVVALLKGQAPRVVIPEANSFDFVASRPLFAYCTPRSTSPLGKIQVWSSELHVGDWRRGTEKAVLSGAIHVTTVSIRP